jgi:hypothetical protein
VAHGPAHVAPDAGRQIGGPGSSAPEAVEVVLARAAVLRPGRPHEGGKASIEAAASIEGVASIGAEATSTDAAATSTDAAATSTAAMGLHRRDPARSDRIVDHPGRGERVALSAVVSVFATRGGDPTTGGRCPIGRSAEDEGGRLPGPMTEVDVTSCRGATDRTICRVATDPSGTSRTAAAGVRSPRVQRRSALARGPFRKSVSSYPRRTCLPCWVPTTRSLPAGGRSRRRSSPVARRSG